MTRLDSRVDWSFVKMVAAVVLVAFLGIAGGAALIRQEKARQTACAAMGAAAVSSGEWQCVRPDGLVIQP